MSKSAKTYTGMSNEVLHVGWGEVIACDKKLKKKRKYLNSETIQNPTLLIKINSDPPKTFHPELITSLWGRTWGTFWITNIAPFFFFSSSDTNVLILMFLSKRPEKITIQLGYFVYQLTIREISKPACRVALSYKGTGERYRDEGIWNTPSRLVTCPEILIRRDLK